MLLTFIFRTPVALLLLATSAAQAEAPLPATVELTGAHGSLNKGQPQANALNLRGTYELGGGDVARAELLQETKFGSRGGIAAAAYTKVLGDDWIVAGTLAAGHGGANWANTRVDVELTTKWLASKTLLSRVALYRALYDGSRSDSGARVALVGYLPGSFVVEGGWLANRSQPGGVNSHQTFGSVTWGSEGEQYIAARFSTGTEAYQSIAAGQQLVGFSSHSVGLNWRRWMARSWGFIAQAEQYRNPSYERSTLGAGVFVQW